MNIAGREMQKSAEKKRPEYFYQVKYGSVPIGTKEVLNNRHRVFVDDLWDAAELIKRITSEIDTYVYDKPRVQRIVVKDLTESELKKLEELINE
jgi:hypothetical protein